MVFSSITFLCYFLPLFLATYLIFKSQHKRNIILLCFSLVFYAWGEPAYVLLMILSIIANWYFGRSIDIARTSKSKKNWLISGIVFNLLMLGVFKYTPFFIGTFALLNIPPEYASSLVNLVMPIGISFYTFQALSYIIDVYNKKFPYEQNILDLGTYISMFPQLIAGPIVRFENIRDQLHETTIKWSHILTGSKLFVIGLASKVIIANTFARYADHVFTLDASLLSAPLAWLGAISYTFQIYFDFNGYSLMAIGLGQIIGFTLPRNFDRPYVSKSITEFWHRWHISLSNWFRDYLYIPLGGNRNGNIMAYRNLVIVFLLCGLWHGASFTFIAWGAYQGFFLIIERLLRGNHLRLPVFILHGYTILIVLLGWVIFRCESFLQAGDYYSAMFGGTKQPVFLAAEVLNIEWVAFAFIATLFSTIRLDYLHPLLTNRKVLATMSYGFIFIFCMSALVISTHNPFIYFRF